MITSQTQSRRHVYLLADIEGSSGCWNHESAAFRTEPWVHACREMSLDLAAAVSGCFAGNAAKVTVRDFHRTCYNVLPELLDGRTRVIQGYRMGEIAGLGDVSGHDLAIFLGMHSSSGSGGFLAHTLTSRFKHATVNGRPLAEFELFAGVLAARGIKPAFFSGCPVACAEARALVPGLALHPIDKMAASATDAYRVGWRLSLASAITKAVLADGAAWRPDPGPYRVELRIRDGATAARVLAEPWGMDHDGDRVSFTSPNLDACYVTLLRLAYLKPWSDRCARHLLPLVNLRGRLGLAWVRRRLRVVRA